MSEFHSASQTSNHPTLPWHHVLHTRQVSENCYASSRATSDDANVDVAAASLHQRSWREVGRVPQALYSTLTNSLPNVIAMYGMTIAMKFKKMPPGVKIAKKWFATRCLGLVHHHYCRWNSAAAKNFAVQALHGNSPRSNIKIRLSKMLRELNKYVTMR